jgi:hypothetical protein
MVRGRMQHVRPREGVVSLPRPAPASRADAILARWPLLVGAALLLRLGLSIVLLRTNLVAHNGWYFPNDDQIFFWGMAHAISADGSIVTAPTTLGYSLLLLPFSLGEFVLQAIPPVAIVQSLLAIPLAYLLYRAGERLLDRRSALVGTVLWLALPVLVGALFVPSYSDTFGAAPGWLGLEIAVDWASAALVIVLLYVASLGRFHDGLPLGLAVGTLGGLLFLAKPNNLIMVAAVLAGLGVWRRWRAVAGSVVTLAALSAPQFAYNHRLYGEPLTFAYSQEFGQWDLVSLSYVPRVFGKLVVSNYTGPLVLVGAALALAVTWLRFPASRWLVVVQAAAVTLFFSTLYYSISGNFLRYLTPVLPLLCLAVGAALVGRRPAAQPRPERGPGRLVAAAAVAVAIGGVALTVWVGRAPTSSAIPTVESMSPAVTADASGTVLLTWTAPDAPADLLFEVRRTPGRPRPSTFGFGNDPGQPGQRNWPAFEQTTWTQTAPPGTWWYRVAVYPGPNPGGFPPGVTLAFSEPVRVVVPEAG